MELSEYPTAKDWFESSHNARAVAFDCYNQDTWQLVWDISD